MLLHQELAALARAGLPLDSGLRSLSHALPGGLGTLANQLAEKLERGESIDDVLRASGSPQQRVYAAVIAAGIRSGNLAKALESVVASAAAGNQLRQNLWMELAYPALLLFVGYGLLEFSFRNLVPVELIGNEHFDASNAFTDSLAAVTPWMQDWGFVLPAFIVLAIVAFTGLVQRGTSFGVSTRWRVGPLARFRREQALHRFFDVLAMLIEHAIPLPEALTLAAESSGWPELAAAAQRMCARLRRGEAMIAESPVPTTVSWLAGSDPATFATVLRREGERRRVRAADLAVWLTRWYPLLITLGVGLSFVVLLAVVNLGPFLNLLHRLSQPGH